MGETKTIKIKKALAAEKSPAKQTSLVAPIIEAKVDAFFRAPDPVEATHDLVDPAANALNAQLQAFSSSSAKTEPHDDKVHGTRSCR